MPNNHRDDIDLATAAEQSSEEDEAQEGNSLDADEESVESAEHEAIHIESDNDDDDDEEEGDLAGLLEALDAAVDPEADAIIDDALDIDSEDESAASVAAVIDEEEIEEAEEALEVPDVTPYDGPDVNGDDDAAVDENGEPVEVDPYEEFKTELRGKPGKWYVIHS